MCLCTSHLSIRGMRVITLPAQLVKLATMLKTIVASFVASFGIDWWLAL